MVLCVVYQISEIVNELISGVPRFWGLQLIPGPLFEEERPGIEADALTCFRRIAAERKRNSESIGIRRRVVPVAELARDMPGQR